MVIPVTKRVALFHFAVLFFIYIDLVWGTPGLFSFRKDKTKEEKAKEIPVRHRRLEMPVIVNHNGKKQKEAFMALVTYPLGFMNTDTQQSPFLENFLTQYHAYKTGYELSISKVKKVFEPEDTWCRDFLKEPVFRDNKIFHNSGISTTQPKKVIHLEYFSKDDEEHEVIQCPVIVRDRKVMLYFATLGVSHFESLKYYFVLTAYKPNDDSKLVVLMRTKFHRNLMVDEDERDCYNEYMYDFSEKGQIRLNIKPDRFKNKYRLFGKYAEAAFILTNYGFWNPTIEAKHLYGFINMALILSKGYEIRRKKLKSKTVAREGPTTCKYYINTSRLFNTYKIKYDSLKTSEITTRKQRITSFIPGIPDQKLRFLMCPVTKGSEDGFILHHPIYFESSPEKRYDLFWYIASDGEYERQEVLLFLAPNKKPIKRVQFLSPEE